LCRAFRNQTALVAQPEHYTYNLHSSS
jgi:hypothetical protein